MKSIRTLTWMLVLVAALSVVGVPPVEAQTGDASVSVVVKDNYGVIPGAVVRLVSADTKQGRRAVTDSSGIAQFSGLAAGSYTAQASLTGFADSEVAVSLAAGETKTVEAVLTLAQFSTSITVTTASRREELLLRTSSPTTLIDEGQLLDTGARSARDVLQEQNGSGIQIAAGGGQGYVSLNGIGNSGVLILVNGRRYLGRDANGNLNLEELQLAGIERVEVVKGAGSALYGSDAMAGVINFITKEGGAEGFKNSATFTGSFLDAYGPGGSNASKGTQSDLRFNDTLSWRGRKGGIELNGGYRKFDGFDLDEKNPQTVGQPESEYTSFSGTADVQLGDKLIARIFGDYNKRDVDNYFFAGATQLASTVYNSQRTLTRSTVSPELEFIPRDDTSFTFSYNYGTYERLETRVYSNRTLPQPDWNEWNQEFKAIGRHSWEAFGRSHPLQGGYEYRKEELERGSLSVPKQTRDINVFWAQQDLNLTQGLKLSAGFRYDDYSDFGSETSPKLGLVYTFPSNHTLRASYGHGFRAPYFGEPYLSQPPFFVGDPDLKPEKSDTFTGGYAYASEKVQVSADYYYAKIKDGVTFDLRALPYTYTNISRFTSQGINAAATVSLPGGFAPSISYTYNKRENEDGEEIGGYPRHSAFAKLLWSKPRLGLRANIRGQINGDVPPSITDGSYQPSYTVWYAQISKKIASRGAYAVNLFAQVDNLFDEKDVYRRDAQGNPITTGLQAIWLQPRSFLIGITLDTDWTK